MQNFFLLIIIGSLFYKFLIIFVFLYIASLKIRLKDYLSIILLTILFSLLVFYKKEVIGQYWYLFVGEAQHLYSKGAVYRYGINAIPALILILYGHNLRHNIIELRTMYLFSLATFLGLILMSISPTAIDRIGLFFTPLQLFVYSNLNLIFKKKLILRISYLVVFTLYIYIYYIWLNHSLYRGSWIPYNFILF